MSSLSNTPSEQLIDLFPDASVSWIDEMTMQCRGVRLQLTRGLNPRKSSPEIITLFKDPSFLEDYLNCLQNTKVVNMVEVGVRDGGSAIFFWNLLHPGKLCCIELAPQAPELQDYIDREDLGTSVRTYFGLDQADRQGVTSVIDSEFRDAPLDLVIDDVSHVYAPSVATFEVLFPRLRTGGFYILEDWKASLLLGRETGPGLGRPPLHQMVHEMLDLSLFNPGIAKSVCCYHNFVVIERGADALPANFSLAAALGQHPGS